MNPNAATDIGQRLELFVDDSLIARKSGVELRLHRPTPREVVLVTDRPWEGNACGMVTVFQDDDRYRMYYRGWHLMITDDGKMERRRECTCYAESTDGVHWERPDLGLVEFNGSKQNNIVMGHGLLPGLHTLAPFKDGNPAAPESARYKAWGVGANPDHAGPPKTPGIKGLFPLQSADGIRWQRATDNPAITHGRFDSHNVVFWDEVRGEYRSYHRNFLEPGPYAAQHDAVPAGGSRGTRSQRDMLTATSKDFLEWSDSALLTYERGKTDQLYTNSIIPYFRAPHIFVGFPMRYIERPWSDAIEDLPEREHRRRRSDLNERYGTALTDTMFMASRDGGHFDLWPESFIRPGLRPQDSWTYADIFPNWGIVTTASPFAGAPDELSIYVVEGYWRGESLNLRRYTMRQDGFVSVQAPASGGELVTRPLVFTGSELRLNFSASAAGSVKVEILQDQEDLPLAGYTLDDCREILGDDLDRRVVWSGSPDVSQLAGLPVRLRFVLSDADLFAFQFRASDSAN